MSLISASNKANGDGFARFILCDDDVEGTKIGNVFIIDVVNDVSCPQPSLACWPALKNVSDANTGTNDLLGRPVMMPMTGASGLSNSELPPRRPRFPLFRVSSSLAEHQ